MSNHQILPNSSVLNTLTWPELAHIYHRYVENIQVVCHTMVRLGNLKDGGWETCSDPAYRPRKPCIIYSFGINDDFTFDDEVSKFYGCHVHSFDPSTTMRDHKRSNQITFHAIGVANFDGTWRTWRMLTLRSIAEELGHEMSAVSMVKLDVEEWEWTVLPEALTSHALDEVSQLLVELHITIKPQPKRERYLHALLTLARLYRSGFRIFYTRRNLHCSFRQIFDGSQKTGCHEVHMVKVHSGPAINNDI
ncbi:hypothetical protein EGW08_021257 [Elysia chlorotica]|uniref:Methyltransferase domain-containing protein n=1 Tax=Elysia chlorotica TaxID=188477 RepID=A0A3S1AXM9_ELYCH|nr:hypothetical protein EGW08_021257 [Elysia chlorotica]